MKKLINEVASVIDEMLEGIALTNSGVKLLGNMRIVVRSDFKEFASSGKVALISGGGSGHEPAHAGYVGKGMLTAAVCGDVFTSPSTDAVLDAIRAVTGPAGCLLIVKNYTGDRLNFGLAAEMARAEGLQVSVAIVADDAALTESGSNAGRRGLAGTVLIHKLCGALAEAGGDLAAITSLAERANRQCATMGVALSPCVVPAAGKPTFVLGEDTIEFGLGIHGEAGVERAPMLNAKGIVGRLASVVFDKLQLDSGDRVAAIVNNLGTTPYMEMAIAAREFVEFGRSRGIQIERIWTGCFLTALDMAGISISVMRLSDRDIELLDWPIEAAAWPRSSGVLASATIVSGRPAEAEEEGAGTVDTRVARVLEMVSRRIASASGELTRLDQQVGDGDLGHNLSKGADAIAAHKDQLSGLSISAMLNRLSKLVRSEVGGTSGALYSAGLIAAAAALQEQSAPSLAGYIAAMETAVNAIGKLGDSTLGDGTMLDALLPAIGALVEGSQRGLAADECLALAVAAAQQGADSTTAMIATRGRASYLANRSVGHPDPGAVAVPIWLEAIRAGLYSETEPQR